MAILIRQAATDKSLKVDNTGIDANRLQFPYWVRAELGEGRVLYTLQGVAQVDFRGNSLTSWRAETLQLDLFLPERRGWELLPQKAGHKVDWRESEFETEHFSATIHPSGLSNWSTATNAGWSVDRITFPQWPHSRHGYIRVEAQLRVRDTDGAIDSVAYNVQLYGREKWTEYFRPVGPF